MSFLGDFGFPPGPLSGEDNSTMSLWRKWMLLTWVLLPGKEKRKMVVRAQVLNYKKRLHKGM